MGTSHARHRLVGCLGLLVAGLSTATRDPCSSGQGPGQGHGGGGGPPACDCGGTGAAGAGEGGGAAGGVAQPSPQREPLDAALDAAAAEWATGARGPAARRRCCCCCYGVSGRTGRPLRSCGRCRPRGAGGTFRPSVRQWCSSVHIHTRRAALTRTRRARLGEHVPQPAVPAEVVGSGSGGGASTRQAQRSAVKPRTSQHSTRALSLPTLSPAPVPYMAVPAEGADGRISGDRPRCRRTGLAGRRCEDGCRERGAADQ